MSAIAAIILLTSSAILGAAIGVLWAMRIIDRRNRKARVETQAEAEIYKA